jgi:hypothetical protein
MPSLMKPGKLTTLVFIFLLFHCVCCPGLKRRNHNINNNNNSAEPTPPAPPSFVDDASENIPLNDVTGVKGVVGVTCPTLYHRAIALWAKTLPKSPARSRIKSFTNFNLDYLKSLDYFSDVRTSHP